MVFSQCPTNEANLMGGNVALPLVRGFGRTDRIDSWWKQPLWMATALTVAVIYTGLRVVFFDGEIHYDNHRVTSPIFSPDIIHMFDISAPSWANSAMLILWIPFGFRGTCYYMRRVYHRVFFQNPTGCVVSKPEISYRFGYKGETGLFVLNNIHRYMLYLAMAVLLIKIYDVWHTMQFHQESTDSLGVSVGTLILATESFLLTMYVVSCHAFRHMIGGGLDRWTGKFGSFVGKLYWKVSSTNVHHAFWFWTSLAMVFIGDLFVWSVAEGILSDPILVMF